MAAKGRRARPGAQGGTRPRGRARGRDIWCVQSCEDRRAADVVGERHARRAHGPHAPVATEEIRRCPASQPARRALSDPMSMALDVGLVVARPRVRRRDPVTCARPAEVERPMSPFATMAAPRRAPAASRARAPHEMARGTGSIHIALRLGGGGRSVAREGAGGRAEQRAGAPRAVSGRVAKQTLPERLGAKK